MMRRLVILSGPSCVGKTTLHKALDELYPKVSQKLKKLVLYNSREMRPKEKEGIDYYFRSRKFIQSLRKNKNFVVLNVRGDLQALDIRKLEQDLKNSNIIFEGNPF